MKRNSRKLFYKLSYGEDEFREVDFLPFSVKNAEDLFPFAIARACGINRKKEQISNYWYHPLPPRKASFWLNLEANDNVDLAR